MNSAYNQKPPDEQSRRLTLFHYLKTTIRIVNIFSIKQVHQCDKDQNKQHFFMSDLEFKPIHKFFRITISSIKYMKHSNSDII